MTMQDEFERWWEQKDQMVGMMPSDYAAAEMTWQAAYAAGQRAERERMEDMPSLYDRTGDIKDLNLRVVPLDAIRNRKEQG